MHPLSSSYVQYGRVVHVAEYKQHMDISDLVDQLPCSEESREVARRKVTEDRTLHVPSPIDYQTDETLYRVSELVEELFPPC
mmetsp:Transcript_3888/g.4504  ORF Transcript_3888/g.4504 Transcript_3888/m.4504 type:complete len:82 (+) Transcript_3888:2-247(+)